MARSLEPYRDRFLPDQFQRWIEIVRRRVGTVPCFVESSGSPEGVITGQKGDFYFDTSGNVYYYKTTDTGNTGWAVLSVGVTPPGGADTEIQFNNAGSFGGFGSWDGSNLEAPGIIAGDPGTEGSGITVAGTTYDSALKASAIGGVDIAQFIMHRHSTTLGPLIVGARSNSDTAAHTLVADNQDLFGIIGVGWDGVDYKIGSIIRMVVDGVAAAGDMPGRIEFYTTPAGSTTALPRMWIFNDGQINLGNFAFDTDQVVGAGTDGFALTYDDGAGLISLVDIASNAAVAANTAKISYTDAAAVAANTAKISYTDAAAVALNTAKVTNATHTGQVTGSGALALAVSAITAQPASGAVIGADTMLINDGGVLSRVTITQLATFFASGGGATYTYTLQAGTTYTAVAGDFVAASNTGSVTITLPAGNVDDTIIVKKIGSGGTVTVDGDGTETIDGALTFALTAQWASITLIHDGSNWLIV